MNPLTTMTADQLQALKDSVSYEAAKAAREEVDAKIAEAKKQGLVVLGAVALLLYFVRR